MTNQALLGAYNGYIPGAGDAAGGKLFVDFSRNVSDFAVNRYVQIVPVKNTVGIWWKFEMDQRARVTDVDFAREVWADGSERPKLNDTGDYFSEKSYRTIRYAESARIGKQASEQASWGEIERRSREIAMRAMTRRTQRVLSKLTDSANYDSTHVANLATPGAITGVTGNWAGSTSARQTIKRTLGHIQNLITLDTNAAVSDEDFMLIMSPDTARQIAPTQEIVEMIKQSETGIKWLEGKELGKRPGYGLLPRLYDYEVVIEKTVKVTSRRGIVTPTRSYVLPLGTVICVARPGSLEGVEGGRSFSTATMHIYRDDDMKLERNDDNWNRLTEISVVDNFDVNMTANVTGFLLTNVV